MAANLPFGIDFGGTGIKGAPVDLEVGEFAAERERIRTPSPSTPEAFGRHLSDELERWTELVERIGLKVP